MLCERLSDPRRLADRHYIAEPKLDGQRAQLHIERAEAVACYSRHGLDLLRHPGMAWLREILVQTKQQLRRGNHDVQWHHDQLASQAEMIARRVRLAWSLIVTLGAVAFCAGVAQAFDCMDRFPEGRFGIALSHPAVAKLVLEGFSPLFVVKQPITIARPEDCQNVYTGDVFRMIEARAVGTLLASCVGDFDGDGRADFALLMKRRRDGVVVPFIFQSRGSQ
jgi:hypothetical protein